MGIKMTTLIAAVAQLLPQVIQGREDVYAVKYEMRNGMKGYSFVCVNNFKQDICPKRALLEEKKSLKGVCKGCPEKRYRKLNWLTLVSHFQGKQCVGLYVVNPEATCQFGVIDLDDKEGAAPLEESPMIVGSILVDKGQEYGLTLYLEKSGGGLGSHCWCLLTQPVRAKRMKELLTGLVKAAGFSHLKDVEVFPKNGTIGADGLGTLVALPFQGPDRMKAGASTFYDPDTLIPRTSGDFIKNLKGAYQLLQEMKRERNTPDEFKEAYARLRAEGHITDRPKRATQARPQKNIKGVDLDRSYAPSAGAYVPQPVEAVFRGCVALGKLQQVGQGKARGDGRDGLQHLQRLFMAGVLRGLPGGREAIHEVIGGGCPDYDPRTTDEYIDSLEHGPWRCETAQEWGVCPYEGKCPNIKNRSGKSPVAFAYACGGKRPTKHQRGDEWQSTEPADLDRVKKIMETIG